MQKDWKNIEQGNHLLEKYLIMIYLLIYSDTSIMNEKEKDKEKEQEFHFNQELKPNDEFPKNATHENVTKSKYMVNNMF